ncbi:MAG: DUF3696 domain-containing protein [Bacteroidales bacterium]|nr:DUF3696 domain-containing protein [Bacteroidales bacterium]
MITRIGIRNFKAFRDTGSISLGALNVLTGVNGRGKSTLMQSILLLSQSMRESDNHSPLHLFTNGEWVRLGSFQELIHKNDDLHESVTFSFVTDEAKDNDYVLTYFPIEADPFTAELRSMLVNGKETFSEAGGYNIESSERVLVPPIFSGYTPLLRLQNMYYVAADRRGASDEEEILSKGINLRLDCHGSNVLNVLYRQGREFHEKVERYLGDIFDGATFKITADDSNIHLYMDSMNGGNLFRPINVGYGYSYVLTLLTAGLLAQKGDIVMVENPEAHLHPSAQAALMKFICKEVITKEVQVFVETHSDHIVNASLLAVRRTVLTNEQMKILFFNRSDSSSDVIVGNLEVTPKGRVKNPPRNFCDQYAMDLRTLMGL